MLEIFTSQKYRKKYLVIILSYRAQDSELQVNLRDQTVVGSVVGLFLEIYRYSCEFFLYGTVPTPFVN